MVQQRLCEDEASVWTEALTELTARVLTMFNDQRPFDDFNHTSVAKTRALKLYFCFHVELLDVSRFEYSTIVSAMRLHDA